MAYSFAVEAAGGLSGDGGGAQRCVRWLDSPRVSIRRKSSAV